MPRRKNYGNADIDLGTLPGQLPTEVDFQGNVRPSGLDLQRTAEAAQIRKMQLMKYAEELRQGNPGMERTWNQNMGRGSYTNAELERINDIKFKAEFDAQNFEKRYTAKQKAEIARWQQLKGSIDQNPDFTDEEKIKIKKIADMKMLDVMPADLPRVSPYPQGRGPGDMWEINGVRVVGKADGETWQIDERKTKSYYDDKKKVDFEQKMIDHAIKLSLEQIEDVDKEGKPTYRNRKTEEVNAIIRNAINALHPEQQETESEQRDRVRKLREEAQPQPYIEPKQQVAKNVGVDLIKVPEEDRQQVESNLSAMTQQANSIIREALANPEKMKDPAFERKARAARQLLSQQ